MMTIDNKQSIYYINKIKDMAKYDISRCYFTERIERDTLNAAKDENIDVILISYANVFSHAANVLRKALQGTKTMAIIGLGNTIDELKMSNTLEINSLKNVIISDRVRYRFRVFDYLRDTSEVIEYDISRDQLCYKPDYYYHRELAEIIIRGYINSKKVIPQNLNPNIGCDGRIWCKEYVLPNDITEYCLDNPLVYTQNLLQYIGILRKLFLYNNNSNNVDEIKALLSEHFTYSLIFSFNTSNLSSIVDNTLDKKSLENMYNIFVMQSPIHNKFTKTTIALDNMEQFLLRYEKNRDPVDCFKTVLKIDIQKCNIPCFMFFVNNMFSDIRRCVINSMIERNEWFAAICKHRKKQSIY